MRESSTALDVAVRSGANAVDDVFDNAARRPEHRAFARKVGGQWQDVTSGQLAGEVTALAAGLIASGIQPGDRIALMSGTSYEWMLCDFAVWAAGAVTVPIYATSSAAQIEWILADSGAVGAFVENEQMAAAVGAAAGSAVRRVWLMDRAGLQPLLDAGASENLDAVQRRRRDVGPDSLATIVYTSGTTGRPKGCMLTHGNLRSEVLSVAGARGISDAVLTPDSSILLFLPLAHILARMVQLAAVHNGARLGHLGDIRHLPAELHDFQPTVVLAVPRVFETLYNTAALRATADGHAALFRAADETAVDYSQALDRGRVGPWLRVRHRVFDRLVYAKLRAAMGGRTVYAVSGGAPLGVRLGHFLRGVGLVILEGWGLTETTAGVTLNLPDAQRIGSVGRPLPGCAVRIADDGEVLVRGGVVFAGYWNDPAATDASLDAGWLHTGDIGELDADGYLSITGRKKDLLITAGGKNVAPAYFEDRLRAHWLIDQCVLVGDRRPYIGALITLDAQGFALWKRNHGRPPEASIDEMRDDPDLLADLQSAIDEVNLGVSRAEAVKRFRVIGGAFTVGEELTPTQKVRREYVLTKYADDVEALYAQPIGQRPDEHRASAGMPSRKEPPMRLRTDAPWRSRRGWSRLRLYGRQWRANHRAIAVGHGERPEYTRKTRRMLTRLFR